MKRVTIYDAKTHLSRLLKDAAAGEDIVITRGRVPVARLVSCTRPVPARRFGAMKGKAAVTDAFFEPLPPDMIEALEGLRRGL
ncbi:MAG TPA: type II toxin-antitoxin system prevent-host-death family antitoxin [Gemmatimonadales bacterium]|nr:type II toxin-antitoxin system prevent-host-death family antitoxin [Gemmatimonadales bacterium]